MNVRRAPVLFYSATYRSLLRLRSPCFSYPIYTNNSSRSYLPIACAYCDVSTVNERRLAKKKIIRLWQAIPRYVQQVYTELIRAYSAGELNLLYLNGMALKAKGPAAAKRGRH